MRLKKYVVDMSIMTAIRGVEVFRSFIAVKLLIPH